MSQHDYDIENQAGAAFRADLNSALQALVGQNSGDTAPATTYANMVWYDTANGLLKQRNTANSAWITVGAIVAGQWVPYSAGESAETRFVRADGALKWLSKPLGEPFPIWDHMAGADIPPTDDPGFRFIRLTAGEDGVGQYNEGVLTGETVTGSSPNLTATATISLAASPFNGFTANLINTDRRFLRAGSSGVLEDSEFESHSHGISNLRSANSQLAVGTGGADRYVGNSVISSTNAQGGSETRPRNIGGTYYVRIL